MKKIILLFSLLITVFTSNAQSGASCATAKDFAPATNYNNTLETQTIQNQWFQFVAHTAAYTINIISLSSGSDKAIKITLWSGTCAEPVKITSDTLTSSGDTVLSINPSLSVGNTYYLEVLKNNGTSTITYSLERPVVVQSPPITCPTCAAGAIAQSCDLVCNGKFEYYTLLPLSYGISTYDPVAGICGWQRGSDGTADYSNNTSRLCLGVCVSESIIFAL